MSDKPLPVKAVFVGDGSVGKSAVVKTFCDGAFPRTSPRPQDNGAPFSVTGVAEPIVVRGEPCEVGFWDTASNEEMNRLRPLAYAHTDVFILCFSVVQPDSLESLRLKWAQEVKFHAPRAALVLWGTKTDLRSDGGTVRRLAKRGKSPVDAEKGRGAARALGAKCYVESSAATDSEGLADAMATSLAAVLGDVKRAITEEMQKKEEAKLAANQRRSSGRGSPPAEASNDAAGSRLSAVDEERRPQSFHHEGETYFDSSAGENEVVEQGDGAAGELGPRETDAEPIPAPKACCPVM